MSNEMTNEFINAKFYATTEDESELSHESYWEAVKEEIEREFDDEGGEPARIRRIGEITVYAFDPIDVDPKLGELLAEQGVRNFIENFEDEYGSPEGDDNVLGDAAANALYLALLAAFTEAVKVATVWQCNKVGSHTFTVEELIEEFGDE